MLDRIQLPGRIHNAKYEHDIRYAMQMCRWILKPIGLWHLIYGRPSQSKKLLSLMLNLACVFCLCFVIIPSGQYILFHEKDIRVKVKHFGPIENLLISLIKYCFLGARFSGIRKCVEYVESDWRIVRHQDHREMMLKNALMGRRIVALCVIFLYPAGISYHTIMPLLAKMKMNDSITRRPLVYPGLDIYFDSQASPVYEIVFCIQFLSGMLKYYIMAATFSLAALFVTHACGQIQILRTLFNDLVDEKKTKDTMKKCLSSIVKHQLHILRLTTDVEEILHDICLMELFASTLNICFLEYYCITEWNNSDAVAITTYFIFLISFSFNILIFCYIGEILMEEYGKIGLAAYNANWYDLSGNKAVGLVMIIIVSHHPPKLTAGKFFDLSLNTFSAVLKTSLVYLNLLRTVAE